MSRANGRHYVFLYHVFHINTIFVKEKYTQDNSSFIDNAKTFFRARRQQKTAAKSIRGTNSGSRIASSAKPGCQQSINLLYLILIFILHQCSWMSSTNGNCNSSWFADVFTILGHCFTFNTSLLNDDVPRGSVLRPPF